MASICLSAHGLYMNSLPAGLCRTINERGWNINGNKAPCRSRCALSAQPDLADTTRLSFPRGEHKNNADRGQSATRATAAPLLTRTLVPLQPGLRRTTTQSPDFGQLLDCPNRP